MPSRQERRKAERDAAKRAPARARSAGAEGGGGGEGGAGAAGAAGAAAALATLSVDPGGDWTTQAADPAALLQSLGAEIVKQKADAGDREAQFSQGCRLVAEARADDARLSGAAGRSPRALVGLALCVPPPLTIPRCVNGHLTIIIIFAVPTLGGGGRGTSGEGGRARARVR
jgi:hypothetical protein